MLDLLDVAAVHRWSRLAVESLEFRRAEIDALNVFPVADSDTGTNLLLTLRAAAEALAGEPVAPTTAAGALAVLARGAAQGAVGNSGFIASQVVRGIAEAAGVHEHFDGSALAAGLDQGVIYGRAAVVEPVEGTILTVARAAADAARAAADVRGAHDIGANAGAGHLAEVVRAAVTAADAAVELTPAQLPELAAAGVVDAGGRGLLVLLDALLQTVTGAPTTLSAVSPSVRGPEPIGTPGGPEFGFEVQYLLEAPETAITALRGVLAGLGDSVAVVPAGGDGSWNVHVHVNDVGAAIEAGVDAGRPRRIAVVPLADAADAAGAAGARDRAARPGGADPESRPVTTAVVAVAPGAGLAHLFESEGVRVVDGGAAAPPSTDDVVAAIRSADADQLILLPNASQVTGIAEAAAVRVRRNGLRVAVVPTRSPVQGLAAIAVHDADRRFDDDVVAMAEAAAATRFAELTIATAEGLTAVGICSPGDVLGLIDGDVVEIGRGRLAVAFNLVDRLLGVGAELITVLVGAEAPRHAGRLIEEHVRGRAPFTDVCVYEGGQPDHPVIIGAE